MQTRYQSKIILQIEKILEKNKICQQIWDCFGKDRGIVGIIWVKQYIELFQKTIIFRIIVV